MWTVVGSLVPVDRRGDLLLRAERAARARRRPWRGASSPSALFGAAGSLRRRLGRDHRAAARADACRPGSRCGWRSLGGAFGIGFGKLIFGGLGQNVFNPALLGRAFLQAAFPVALTTWPALGTAWWQLRGDNFALPLMAPRAVDVVTAATPLGLWKFERQGDRPVGPGARVHRRARSARPRVSLILLCGALPRAGATT